MSYENSKLRVETLMKKVDVLEEKFEYFETQKNYIFLGLPSEYSTEELLKESTFCKEQLLLILSEIRYIRKMNELNFEINLN